MEAPQLNWLANFIWGIADDVLRDLYVRGKYRDVILPMTVLRRLDAVLEPTKQVVLDMKAKLDKAKIVHQDQALRQAAGQAASPLIVQSFPNPARPGRDKDHFRDFELFGRQFSVEVGEDKLVRVPREEAIPLYLGWVTCKPASDADLASLL